MKTLRKIPTGDPNCKCLSYLDKSASDNPAVERYIKQGSRIDRLFYGKYIPLRERKLLERLVRTRAVYDDIRTKLISDSTISLSTKADTKSKEQDDIEASDAIFEIINLVDKGASLGLNEHCSCCSCSSKGHILDHKRHKHHRSHFGARSQVVQKERLDTNRRKKGVRFKAKSIRSSCKCLFKLLKNKENVGLELFDWQQITDEERQSNQRRIQEFAHRSLENIKQTKTQIGEKVSEGVKKIKESKTNIQERLQLNTQSSAVRLKQATNRLKTKRKNAPPKRNNKNSLQLNELLGICLCSEDQIFKTPSKQSRLDLYKEISKEKLIQAKNKLGSAMKSTIERKPKSTKLITETSSSYIAPENNLALRIKKDSIRKFKEELRRKQIMKDWECDPECVQGICVPEEECFIKLKKKRKHMKQAGLEHRIRNHEKKTGPVSNQKNVKVQETAIEKSRQSGINYKIEKKQKMYRHQRTSDMFIKGSSRDSQTEKRSLKRCFCTLKLKSKRSKGKHKKKLKNLTAEKSITTLRPLAPCKQSDCSVEMCDKMVCEELMSRKLSNAQTNTANELRKKRDIKPRHLLPYECEPGVCSPGDCDPYECIKLINSREAKFTTHGVNWESPSRKTKSTSTFTSRSHKPSKAKIAQSLYTYGDTQKRNEGEAKVQRKYVHNAYDRQAVRIGSTFSFNIEFYKNKPPQQRSDLNTVSVKPKLKERGYQGDVASLNKNMPTQVYKKARDEAITTTLKRCFCTLKLQRKSHLKLKKKTMFSTGTRTVEEPFMSIETSTKATKTKQKYMKSLKPYECEPFTCIPGECNPYECLERIKRRNLRDIGVSSTLNRSDINKCSCTSETIVREVNTQSKPRTREQKVLTKVKKHKKQTKTSKPKLSYSSSAPSKQAVRIGSSFSFNVEFSKKKIPKTKLIPNYEMRPAVKLETRPISRNRGSKIIKLNVADLDTQVEELKKRNKTSTTKPLLKRCFCTLNLQKRKNNASLKSSFIKSNVYTVNRAMVKQNKLSILQTQFLKNICLSRNANINMNKSFNDQLSDSVIKSLHTECKKLNSIKHLQCKSSYPLITNTDKFETIKSKFNTELSLISQSFKSDNLKVIGIENSQLVKDSNNVNVYSPHFNQERKCVVRSSNNFNGEKNHLTGLGQNLKSNFCTMNLQVVRKRNVGKQSINSDIVNEGSNVPWKLKPYECEPGVCVPGECDPYECLKLISKRGSNFSKKSGTESTATTSSSYTGGPRYRSYKVQSKQTKPQMARRHKEQHKLGDKNVCRVGSTFSFNIEFSKKSGSPQIEKPKMDHSYPKKTKSYLSKTTKMNNEGYHNRHSQSPFSKTLQKASATLPRMKRCFCTLKLQKKGRLRNEGHMQPSEGLQTEAIIPQLTTTNRGQNAPKFKPLKVAQPLEPHECPPGICEPGQCNPYECLKIMKMLNSNQTADFGTDARIGESKSFASMTVSQQKHRTRKINAKPRVVSKTNLSEERHRRKVKPEKQAVRISSCFSFNIEFNKTNPSCVPDLKKRHIKMKHMPSETSKARRNKQSQIENTVHAVSTMTTSLMKRCFCVLKLGKNKNKNIVDNKPVKVIDKPQNMDKKTNTKRYKERVLQLEPYECEPGICIPGECDPYVCEKLIKRRNNLRSTSSYTDFNSTRSASSSFGPGTKNINTQFRPRETKEQVYTKTKIRNSDRQAVRIGSNFSFDIEFYKHKTSKCKDHYIPRVKTKDRLYLEPKKKKQKNSGTKSQSPTFRSETSQIQVNKRDFAAGINNVFKRCFCTLQLYNQRSGKQRKNKQVKKKPITKEVHSKQVMTTEKNKIKLDSLLPYECEPNICVPYECDPHECEKLIKLRNRKKYQLEKGMSTPHTSKHSISSSTAPFRNYKKRTQSVSFQNEEKKRHFKSPKRTQEAQSKQCVKIGSSFSFNVEFFKDKTPAGLQLDQKPQYIRPHLDRTKRKIKTKSQALQSQKYLHASPSQMDDMKTQSTMARLTPPLKRCFCTFYLKKPVKEPHLIPEPLNVNVGTETKFRGVKVQPVPKLLDYECEPNICIPGECNPLECLERIKTRLKHQKNYGTCTPCLKRYEAGSSMGTRTRNKRSQLKPILHVERRPHAQPITNKPNRQAVRIGSNFSFNIDFYKETGLDNYDRRITDEHKPKCMSYVCNKRMPKIDKQVYKNLDHKVQFDRGNQSPYIKQSSKSSRIDPFLKRCFCTLIKKQGTKIEANKDIPKLSPPKVATMDRGSLTKKYKNTIDLHEYECEPYTCIPGECDPYECLKRIEERKLKYKSISTQMLKQSSQSQGVGLNLANMNSKNTQSKLLPTKSKQSHIVKVPRFGNLFNKQAVKIGSNFSFNIEFYREFLPPNNKQLQQTNKTVPKCKEIKCYEGARPKIPKKYSVMTSQGSNYHNQGIQGDRVKTNNKALEVGNALKRCFCTLKLQKELNSKQSRPKVTFPKYPQVIEVRRVSVQNKCKKKNKQTLTETKSIGTKTKEKYFIDNPTPCIPFLCNSKIIHPQDVSVIFPYVPNKFNKIKSKTAQNKQLCKEITTKPRVTRITNRGKRLTKKKHFHCNDLPPSKPSLSNLQKFMCKCKRIFSHKTQSDEICTDIPLINQNQNKISTNKKNTKMDNSKIIINDRRSHDDDPKQKSLELKHKHTRKCDENCSYINGHVNSKYQAGDISQNPVISIKILKKHGNDKTLDKIPRTTKDNEQIKQIQESSLKEKDDFYCSHCKKNYMNKRHSQPLKVHFRDTPLIKDKNVGKRTMAKDGLPPLNKSVDQIDKRRKKNDIKSRKSANYCDHCVTCGKKLNNEEIKKAAGDQKSIKSVPKEESTILQQFTCDKIKNLFKCKLSVDNICSAEETNKPLFEMHLDSANYGILNRDEVVDNVNILNKISTKVADKKHPKSCSCCICLAKKSGAAVSVKPKGPKFKEKHVLSKKPCVCGSTVCAKRLAKMSRAVNSKNIKPIKPCYCGSPVCAAETKIMKAISDSNVKITCICEKEMAKQKRNKQRSKRLKHFDKADKIRRKLRHKQNKKLERRIDKNSSAPILLAESFIDIGKFGVTACADLLRLVARTATDPKHAYKTLKSMKNDPRLIARYFKSGIASSGMSSTCRRVRLRCLSIKGVKNTKNFIESYSFPNYLLHIADKNPRKRLVKRKVRQREQEDFNCSLYMGSLRKRPFLWVYNKLPWFYPHFLSLINVWKQFTDIALFLLAAVVWSPCIFCMEACRAFVCCFLCTG